MGRPVFYDPTGRRSRWSKRAVALAIVLAVGGALTFASTLLFVRPERELVLRLPQPHASELQGVRPRHGIAKWLPHTPAKGSTPPLSIGFYLPGDDPGFHSLQRHAGSLDWVVPAQVTVAGPRHLLAFEDEARFSRAIGVLRDPPRSCRWCKISSMVNGTVPMPQHCCAPPTCAIRWQRNWQPLSSSAS